MAFPFDKSNLQLNMGFIFVKDGTGSGVMPKNLGYAKEISITGGDELNGFEAENSFITLKPFIASSSFEANASLMEAADDELLALIENSNWIPDPSDTDDRDNLMPILSVKSVHIVSVQIIVPQMEDITKCADGIYIPQAALVPIYDNTFDRSSSHIIGLKVRANPVKMTSICGSDFENKLATFFRIKKGVTIDVDADGKGYDPEINSVSGNWTGLEELWE